MHQLTDLVEQFQAYFIKMTPNTFKIAAGTLVRTIENVSESYEKAEWLLNNGRKIKFKYYNLQLF